MSPDEAAPPRSTEQQQQLESALREIFEKRIAFNELLGIRVESFDPKAARVSFDMRPEFVGHFVYGRLHGGVISAVLDAAGGFGLMCAIAEKYHSEDAGRVLARFGRMGTIDLRVDFLRQGIGKHFEATMRITRLGGRVGSVQGELVNEDGTLIATASAAYMIS